MITFQEIFEKHKWKPIKNCPGRYILDGGPQKIQLTELLDREVKIKEFHSPKARDAVFVVEFSDGGMISYLKKDGTYIHTFCNVDGFKRKLKQLEIELPLPGS